MIQIRNISNILIVATILFATQIIASTISTSKIKLTNGTDTTCITHANSELSISVIPKLGGKIISIKDIDGFEFVSRSGKPYSLREYGGKFGDKEFDGIDEIFPTLSACKYPAAPWQEVELPPHGELFSQPWNIVSTNNVICMAVKGKALPYLFQRTITLKGSSVVLDYEVTNLSSNDIYYFYLFHPLLTGLTGTQLKLEDDQLVKISYNYKEFLGKMGTEANWGDLMIETNKVFKENMFKENSGKYWKIFATLPKSEVILEYPNKKSISLEWEAEAQPKFAVWTSEGMSKLHHIAPEPTTSFEESLEDAYKNGNAKCIKANSKVKWQTTLTIEN